MRTPNISDFSANIQGKPTMFRSYHSQLLHQQPMNKDLNQIAFQGHWNGAENQRLGDIVVLLVGAQSSPQC